MEKTYTLNEVGDMAKVSRMTLYRHINSGKLKAFKIGQAWRVNHKDLMKYLGN